MLPRSPFRTQSEEQRQAAKQARRQAYLQAKERRAQDPRYLELKAAAKARRREHYERAKQHRKAARVAERAVRSAQRAQAECDERAFFQKGRAASASSRAGLRQALQRPPAADSGVLGPWQFGVAVANDVR